MEATINAMCATVPTAIEELFTTYHARLIRIARGSEDAVMAAYDRILSNSKYATLPAAELMNVAVCAVRRFVIDDHRQAERLARALRLNAIASERPARDARTVVAMEDAIARLPAALRYTLRAKARGESDAKIAERLSVSAASVRVYAYRARESVREYMEAAE